MTPGTWNHYSGANTFSVDINWMESKYVHFQQIVCIESFKYINIFQLYDQWWYVLRSSGGNFNSL